MNKGPIGPLDQVEVELLLYALSVLKNAGLPSGPVSDHTLKEIQNLYFRISIS